jgi:adenylate kinase family enzyme
MGASYLELDSLHHQPGWVPLDDQEFRRRVEEVVKGPSWVVDGNYSTVRSVVWPRADTVVWLDPPDVVAMARLLRRTLKRAVTREELWNGNRERLSYIWSRDPELSILRYAWGNRKRLRNHYEAETNDSAWAHLRFVRARSRTDRRRLFELVGGTSGQ